MGRGDFKVKLKLELRDNKLLVYVSLHYRVCYIHLMTNASSVAGITALREPSVFQFCQQWDSSVYHRLVHLCSVEQDCSQPNHKDRGDKSCRRTRINVIVCLPESIASKVGELWSIWTPIVWTVVIFTDVAHGGRHDIVEGHGPPRLVVVVIDEDRCRLLVGHPICAESLNRRADLNTRYRVKVDHHLCVLLLSIHSLHTLVSETED